MSFMGLGERRRSVPELPSDGTPPPHPRYFPAKHGFRFGFFTIPPDAVTNLDQIDTATAFAEIERKLPGMIEVLEPDHPGMHTTETVDFDVVVSGRWRRGSVESRRLRGAERNTPRLAEPVGAALCDRRHSRGSRAYCLD
jgi:hypothetical protein